MKQPDDFVDFLSQLVEGGDLEGAAKGVAAHAMADGGLNGLTGPQHATLVLAVKGWISEVTVHEIDRGSRV